MMNNIQMYPIFSVIYLLNCGAWELLNVNRDINRIKGYMFGTWQMGSLLD